MRLSPLKKLRLTASQNLPYHFSARILGIPNQKKPQPLFYLNRYGLGPFSGERGHDPSQLNLKKTAKEFSFFPSIKKVPKVFNLARYGDNNYWHWMLEYLPSLTSWDGSTPVFAPQNKKFHRETLAFLGIPRDLIIDSYSIDYIITPEATFPLTSLSFSDEKLAFWQAKRKIVPHPAEQKIYISRTKATSRRVVNEEEILPLLAEAGYRTVFAEDLSFSDQVQLFQTAQSIITTHGAALSNLVFCPKKTRLIEIVSPEMKSEMAMTSIISRRVELTHEFFFAEATNPHQPQQGDLKVDLLTFKKILLSGSCRGSNR